MANEIAPGPQSAIDRFVEKLNLPEMIAGPAGRAISRLVAGAMEIPAAYLDSFAQSIKDKTTARTLVSQEVTAAAAKLAAGDADIIARAAHNLLAKEYRHQKNKEDIAKKALQILQEETQALPAPPPASKDGDAQPTPPNVDDDWLNIFERYAETASSERLQELWARILAGEIRRPKTFSLKTLRFVSELDQETATLFEKNHRYICANAIPTRPALSGAELTELLHLQDAGLLAGVGGLLNQTLTLDAAGRGLMPNQERFLLFQGQPNQPIAFPAALLTKIGSEISRL